MNPQFMSQQPPQYGGSTVPGYPPHSGGYNPQDPSATVGNQAPGFPPSQARGPSQLGGMNSGGMPYPPNPNQIAGQMANMNIGGPPRPSSTGFPGGPMKSGAMDGMPDGYPSVINGGSPNDHQKGFNANSKQFVNGSMGPLPGGFPPPPPQNSSQNNHSGMLPSNFPPMSSSPNNMPPQHVGPPHQLGNKPPMSSNIPPQSGRMPQPGGIPPQPGGMPPQPGGMFPQQTRMPSQPSRLPPQSGGMPPPPGGMSQPGGMPPQPGSMPPQPGGMPPPPGGMLPPPGGMPPPSGGMPPPSGGMPPQSGGMPPPSGGMPPQSGGMPPQSGGMPPPPGGMPPQSGGMPPQSGGMPPQSGGMPPPPGGMPPPPGGMPPQSGGMPPPPGGMPPQSGGMPSAPGGMPPQSGGMPPPHGGMHPQHGMPPPPSGMHSQHGGLPPPPGAIPSQHGGMPPLPGGMPSQPGMPPPPGGVPPQSAGFPPPSSGGMPQMRGPPQIGGQMQNAMPPSSGRMSYNQPAASPSMDSYQGNVSGPTGSGYGGTHQQMGHMQGHNYSQLPPQPAASHPSLQSQQARRLDPDQMPSPIQVMQDDQRNRSGMFYTNQRGQVPPLVTTDFVTQDQGNAGPRYIRSTMYNIPATIDMMKQTAVPFGLVLSPLARAVEGEYPPPIVDMGELGPVRCIRCKAYMCPFMQFIDGGRRFHCLFCKATTEVPAEYFQHLDHTGQRVDRFERPELMLGAYEFVATKDYCRNNTYPKPPALIFLIDVSYNNIKSGMVHLLCKEMRDILKLLPKDSGAKKSAMRVGFITYNNTVHFYNIKGCLAQPQMMVVGDVQDMFMPLLEGFLCDPEESEAVIDSLMEQIPAMFADTRETETVLAPAIQAGLEALKASECAGKLLVFHSSLPIAEAPGKLKNRDERKLLGTEKEKTVLAPQVNTYNNLGQDCVGAGCSVDLFVLNNSYIDLATIGQVCRLTGGEIFKYTYFQADLDGDRLISDIKRDVSRPIAFDAIMRVRTSTGVRATDFYGHFFMSNTTDMELASIDCDKAVAVEVKHDDKLTEEDGVYAQVALLYTSCGGQRRLRILNLSFKTCSQMADLYRSCDLDSIVNFFSKQVVFHLLDSSPKQVKDGLVNRCAQMLACYRKNCASPSSAGQLILPECMKLLPLYVNCILKSDAVSGGSDMTIDDRSFVMQAVSIMDLPSSVVYFYPRLIPLHEIDVDATELPAPIRCTADKIRDDGVYLLENGVHMFLWIGLNVGNDWVQSVFGVHSAAQIDIDRTALPELDNSLSQRICSIVYNVRQQRHRSMRLTLVRQRDKLEMVFKHFLVEDRGFDGSASYVDFLCHMHKEIRNLLS